MEYGGKADAAAVGSTAGVSLSRDRRCLKQRPRRSPVTEAQSHGELKTKHATENVVSEAGCILSVHPRPTICAVDSALASHECDYGHVHKAAWQPGTHLRCALHPSLHNQHPPPFGVTASQAVQIHTHTHTKRGRYTTSNK